MVGNVQHLGICQWFHKDAKQDVRVVLEMLDDLGVKHLRTNFSWHDFVETGGQDWYDWLFDQLKFYNLEILLCVDYTPAHLSENHHVNGPPRYLNDHARMLWDLFDRYSDCFNAIQFGTEVNNHLFWDFLTCDPGWAKYGKIVRRGAEIAKLYGKTTVLGGMSPIDHHWLELMFSHDALDEIDVIAIHGFAEVPWNHLAQPDRSSWQEKIDYISPYLRGKKLWVTETGFPSVPPGFKNLNISGYAKQIEMLSLATFAPVERLYWYSAMDLAPNREAIEGFWTEPLEYFFGLSFYSGKKKPAYETMKQLQTINKEF